jgi:hypothetical protein
MAQPEVKLHNNWWYITKHPKHWFAGYPFPSQTAALEALTSWVLTDEHGAYSNEDIPI